MSHGADIGLAHDGDADRCLAVDAEGNIVDGDAIMVIMALAMKEAGRAGVQHARHHRDEQPRPAPGDARGGRRGAHHGCRRPLCARGTARRRILAGRRTIRTHRDAGDGHHRRRHRHRAAADVADGADAHAAGRAGVVHAPAAAGADQRRGRRTKPPSPMLPRCVPRSPRPKPSWATPAESCCGPREPSRWCG